MESADECRSQVFNDLAPVYDRFYGRFLHRCRRLGVGLMGVQPGMRVLEIGIGTGLSLPLYPKGTRLVGIDTSEDMLGQSHARVGRLALSSVELLHMSGERLLFEDESFDRVFAPSVLSVMARPERALEEMIRVCRPDGRICVVGHFAGRRRLDRLIDRALDPFTRRFLGYRTSTPRGIVALAPGARVIVEAEVLPFNFSTAYLLERTVMAVSA